MQIALPRFPSPELIEGILLVNKTKGSSSFSLVQTLRRRLEVKKIGHAGTLDPFASGVMVMLIGRNYTRLSDRFLGCDKEYIAEVFLGITTDTYDSEGKITLESMRIPSLEEIREALNGFQGEVEQIPPMYSAKKIGGKKLYELAREGREVARKPVRINLETHFIRYQPPILELRIVCSKGTYIRSIAHDLGLRLACGAHLANLKRTRSGKFCLQNCLSETELYSPSVNLQEKFVFS